MVVVEMVEVVVMVVFFVGDFGGSGSGRADVATTDFVLFSFLARAGGLVWQETLPESVRGQRLHSWALRV